MSKTINDKILEGDTYLPVTLITDCSIHYYIFCSAQQRRLKLEEDKERDREQREAQKIEMKVGGCSFNVYI